MSNHTGGDWEMVVAPGFGPEEYEGITIESPSTGTIICEMAGGLPVGEILANARLVKEAPELLDCLKDALDIVGSWGEGGDPVWAQRSRKAIAKVEGEET
jgi:hypothetical protein